MTAQDPAENASVPNSVKWLRIYACSRMSQDTRKMLTAIADELERLRTERDYWHGATTAAIEQKKELAEQGRRAVEMFDALKATQLELAEARNARDAAVALVAAVCL